MNEEIICMTFEQWLDAYKQHKKEFNYKMFYYARQKFVGLLLFALGIILGLATKDFTATIFLVLISIFLMLTNEKVFGLFKDGEVK